VPPLQPGTYALDVYEHQSPGTSTPHASATVVVASASSAAPNFTGLWWNAPAGSESGWGISVEHQGDVLFAVWFTYDGSGKGQWLVASNVAKDSSGGYSGPLYRMTGPSLTASQWSAATATPVGSVAFHFDSATSGSFNYTVDGASGTKLITRQVFSSPVPQCVAQ